MCFILKSLKWEAGNSTLKIRDRAFSFNDPIYTSKLSSRGWENKQINTLAPATLTQPLLTIY